MASLQFFCPATCRTKFNLLNLVRHVEGKKYPPCWTSKIVSVHTGDMSLQHIPGARTRKKIHLCVNVVTLSLLHDTSVCVHYTCMEIRDGAVVRALASHQCAPASIPGPGVICELSLFAPRGFSPGTLVFPSPQNQHFPTPIQSGLLSSTLS